MIRTRQLKPLITMTLFFAIATMGFSQLALVSNVFVVDSDISEFPLVSLVVRPLDSGNSVPPALTDKDLDLYENNTLAEGLIVEDIGSGPMNIVFIIDRGEYSSINSGFGQQQFRNILQLFQTNNFRDGIDTVTILEEVNLTGDSVTRVVLEPTQSSAAFLTAITEMELSSTGQTTGLDAVQAAYDMLKEVSSDNPGRVSATIVLISAGVEWPDRDDSLKQADLIAEELVKNGVKVFTLHTHPNASLSQALQRISSRTFGTHLQLVRGANNDAALRPVYSTIMSLANLYKITYNSRVGDSGVRVVSVVPKGAQSNLAADPIEFSVVISNPQVTLESPLEGATFDREAVLLEEGTWKYGLDAIPVIAIVSWPDGYERDVASIQLLADGLTVARVDNPGSNSRLEVIFDVTSYRESANVELQVQVIDQFGLTGLSPTSNMILTVGEVLPPNPCATDPGSRACWIDRIKVFAPWVVIIPMAIYLVIMRQTVAAVARGTIQEARKFAKKVATDVFGIGATDAGELLARIHVEAAESFAKGEVIEIHNDSVTLGRDPERSDYQLYSADEVSSVSGAHFQIQFDRGRFLITDLSTYGTVVNGVKLTKDSPVELKDGSIIVLGHIMKKGARVRFEIADAGRVSSQGPVKVDTVINEGRPVKKDTVLDIDEGTEYVDDDLFNEPPPAVSNGGGGEDKSWMDDL